jgi:hypothetical protein
MGRKLRLWSSQLEEEHVQYILESLLMLQRSLLNPSSEKKLVTTYRATLYYHKATVLNLAKVCKISRVYLPIHFGLFYALFAISADELLYNKHTDAVNRAKFPKS